MLRAFIVEDSPTIRDNLAETLLDMELARAVGFADSESAALAWMREREEAWDLAIVDLFLVQGSGLGVLAAIAHRPSAKKVVV